MTCPDGRRNAREVYMDFRNKTERIMYEKEDSPEKGEAVVLAYRKYLEDFAQEMSRWGREKTRDSYYPRNEKPSATMFEEYKDDEEFY